MSDIRVALTQALGPLYRIEREVRPVGEVRLFVARQSPTGPDLLVKVLPAALSLAMDAAKLEREVLLIADKVRHSNIVAPTGAGRAGPFVYHTRPFVPGTTLRAWLQNNGATPLARAVAILRSVLAGLAHAHSVDIPHGDLKAENVLLTEGAILVADPGIAAAVARSHPAVNGAPPQAIGPREDMRAVAQLVNEMLAGGSLPPRREREAVEQSRTLPSWLAEWMRGRWTDAGKALAAIRAPRSSQQPPQPFA